MKTRSLFTPDSVSSWQNLMEKRLVSASIEAGEQLAKDSTMIMALKWISMVATSFLAPVNHLQPLSFSASIGHTCVLLLTCLWGFAHRMAEAMFLRIMPLALAMLVIKISGTLL